jgi:hypothetical protein
MRREDHARSFFATGYSTPHCVQRNTFTTASTALCIGANSIAAPQSGHFGVAIASLGLMSGWMSDVLKSDMTKPPLLARRNLLSELSGLIGWGRRRVNALAPIECHNETLTGF